MVRVKFLWALALTLLLFAAVGCDDPAYFGEYGFDFAVSGGASSNDKGAGDSNDVKDCPIPVPTPDDGDISPTPTPLPGDDGDDNDGDDNDGDDNDGDDNDGDGEDDGTPANGQQCEVNELTVCHIPRGNPENSFTVCVGSEGALDAHLNHGDLEGTCEDDNK